MSILKKQIIVIINTKMNILGGYLGKSAGYFYSITNIKVEPYGWQYFWINIDGIRISKVCNNNNIIDIVVESDNQYNINLFVNKQKFHTSKHLFKYSLEFDNPSVDTNKIISYSESVIVDH